MITIVHGPKASGKTLNRDLIKAHVGADRIVDDFTFQQPLKDGDLALTFHHPSDNIHAIVGMGDVRLVSIESLKHLPGFTIADRNFFSRVA